MENKILNAACVSRKNYEALVPHVDKPTFTDKGQVVWKAIRTLYNEDTDTGSVDKELLVASLSREHPKAADTFKEMLSLEYTASPQAIAKELNEMQLTDVKADLQAAFSIHGNEDKVEDLLKRYWKLKDNVNEVEEAQVYHNKSLNDIFEATSSESRIQLYPKELQAATRGALRGHHILIFARPDMGKSTMAGELIAGFLEQNLRVMYVGNEDPPDDLMSRFSSRLLKKPISTLERNIDKANQILIRRNWGNFYFVEMFPGTVKEIREKVDDYRPDVLIVDQVRNLESNAGDRTRELELVERGVRNLGKKYKMLTISFTQAGDSAEGERYLSMSDVDSSKTGMQASADLMVGIGATEDDEAAGIRWLSYPKNKLSGSKSPSRVHIDFSIFKVGT